MNISLKANSSEPSQTHNDPEQDISAKETIRLVLQFLKEQNLTNSFYCLQQESGVCLSAVDTIDGFVSDVANGNIRRLIEVCGQTKLPGEVLFEVFEHVCCELVDANDLEAFNSFFNESMFSQSLDKLTTEKRTRLAQLRQAAENSTDIWDGHPNQKVRRRKQIARIISKYLEPLPPNQLLKLLTHTQEASAAMRLKPLPTELPNKRVRELDFPNKITCTIHLNDDSRICSGSAAGDIVISDWRNDKLQLTQLQCENMSTVSCLSLSADGQVIASGDICGSVCLWQLSKYKLGVKLKNIHTGSIQSIDFHSSDPSLLTTATDNKVKVTKIVSSAVVLNISDSNPDAPVRQAFFDTKCKRIITGSSDGMIRIYSAKTGILQKSKKLEIDGIVTRLKKFGDSILVLSETQAWVIDQSGSMIGIYKVENEKQFIKDAVIANSQNSLIVLTAAHRLIMYDILEGRIIQESPADEFASRMEVDSAGRNLSVWCQDGNKILCLTSAT